ncbi:MAG TPA: nucleotidyltransferase family protein [Solirubrobacteraceae bacterium]
MALTPELLQQAAWCLAVDTVTAEVIGDFEACGIDVLLVKGPVIGRWLYPREVRPYGDGDLVVASQTWDRAVARLEVMGFRDYLGPLEHPRMESEAGTGFLRGLHSIDLHSTLPGLGAEPADVWRALSATSKIQEVGGRSVHVPDRIAVLMHIPLHAVHHVEGKPLEDLARAVRRATDEEWRAAAGLAARLGGLEAFATGMRLLPEAADIARRLDLAETGSIEYDLRTARVPLAEGLSELMSAPVSGKTRIVARELFPNTAFMRWSMPLARTGRAGLVASYPLRWLSLIRRLPAAGLTVYRVRRRRSRA